MNKDEILIQEKDSTHRKSGEEHKIPDHKFSNDVDLFGQGSFFQFINRSSIIEGERKLVEELVGNNINDILTKQKFKLKL